MVKRKRSGGWNFSLMYDLIWEGSYKPRRRSGSFDSTRFKSSLFGSLLRYIVFERTNGRLSRSSRREQTNRQTSHDNGKQDQEEERERERERKRDIRTTGTQTIMGPATGNDVQRATESFAWEHGQQMSAWHNTRRHGARSTLHYITLPILLPKTRMFNSAGLVEGAHWLACSRRRRLSSFLLDVTDTIFKRKLHQKQIQTHLHYIST
jgi:hypothetical protein